MESLWFRETSSRDRETTVESRDDSMVFFQSFSWLLGINHISFMAKRKKKKKTDNGQTKKKERCSGSYRLAVGFLVIKDESISERPG